MSSYQQPKGRGGGGRDFNRSQNRGGGGGQQFGGQSRGGGAPRGGGGGQRGNFQGSRGGFHGSRGGGGGGRGGFGGAPQYNDPTPMKEIESELAVDEAKRSWVGKNGKTCQLLVNFFNLKVNNNLPIFRYNVDVFDIPIQREEAAGSSQTEHKEKKPEPTKSRETRQHALWTFLREKFPDFYKKPGFAYDDRDILYSVYDLMPNGEDADPRRDISFTYHVTIRAKQQWQLDIQSLNIILTSLCRQPFGILADRVQCEIDRRFLIGGRRYEAFPIKECLLMLRGLKSAIKKGPGNQFLANYDVHHSAFLKPKCGLLEFYAMSKGISMPSLSQGDLQAMQNMSMNDDQKRELNTLLHGMRLRTTYGEARSHRYTKIADSTAATTVIDGKNLTVAEYFKKKLGKTLDFPNLPLVWCGNEAKKILIPMELLTVDASFQRIKMKLPDELQALTNSFTTTEPKRRFNHVLNLMDECRVHRDETAAAFGIEIGKKMLEIGGRILGIPQAMQRLQVASGFPVVDGGRLAVVNVNGAVRDERELREKAGQLANFCQSKGLRFTGNTEFVELNARDRRRMHQQLDGLKDRLSSKSLVLFVVHNSDKCTYDDVKTYCDLELGLRTQFMRQRTFCKIPQPTLLSNMWRKMNNKVGGRNAYVPAHLWPKFTNPKEPTMFVGIDVTHPGAGEAAATSVAALVGNLDLEAATYGATVRILPPRCEKVEVVGEMLVQRLKAFEKKNGMLPKHIVVFRDGVSESQFDMVLDFELASMKRWTDKKPNYKPTFTVVIVQKRHATRFYAPKGGDPKGNVLPGTVVDRYITNEEQKEYYLCAHKGLLGTSRPIHCVVLEDQWNLTADEVQHCTNVLCNLVGRASGPVSLPAPVQYAHLVCFRARSYMNSYRRNRQPLPNPLKAKETEKFDAHEDLRSFMYFS
ncbi:hypothetical protein M3Y99_00692300 [Aphelenchoides fujianensis]|nr:hypothetical protein M3Y99_00692300 [Aphelenchoides fujianensis]